MPIYQSDADKARELISLYADVPATQRAAEEARNDADTAAKEDIPSEIIAAYRVLADQAAATASRRKSYTKRHAWSSQSW